MKFYNSIEKQLKVSKDITTLLEYMKVRSPMTYTHSVNVAFYTKEMVYELYADNEYMIHEIIIGSLLHDIGKCVIPNELLEKKGYFTSKEMDIVKEHVTNGAAMLEGLTSDIIIDICRFHHERLDGSGYLYHTIDIPLYVQIVSVADIYEALRSERTYKSAYSHNESIKILMKEVYLGKIDNHLVSMLDSLKPNKRDIFVS